MQSLISFWLTADCNERLSKTLRAMPSELGTQGILDEASESRDPCSQNERNTLLPHVAGGGPERTPRPRFKPSPSLVPRSQVPCLLQKTDEVPAKVFIHKPLKRAELRQLLAPTPQAKLWACGMTARRR